MSDKKEKFELTSIPLKPGTYQRPKRTNPNVPAEKYDRVDKVCENEVFLSNDGNAYVPKESMPTILNTNKNRSRFIADNLLSDDSRRVINGKEAYNSSELIGFLDKRSHETRNAEHAAIDRYSRDALIGIGDSDQAEAVRRQLDAQSQRTLPRLKNQRGVDFDEITGDPLEKNSAFHHLYEKSIYTNPADTMDPDKGINVNADTHQEIHRRNIHNPGELERQKEDIKQTVKRKRNNK